MNKFLTLSIGLAAVAGLASCDNQVKEDVVIAPEVGGLPEVVLPQAPDLVISSLGNTLAGNSSVTKAGETRATTKYENDEVEINLSLQDAHKKANGENKYAVADLVSHLSIHVRSYTDVEVTLPVPAAIYCDQDDLYIYNERAAGFNYEGSVHTATYTLEEGETYCVPQLVDETKNKYEDGDPITVKQDHTVTLNISFAPAKKGETEGYITIWTEGITKEVIDYCKWTYGDGLNFDAYNYYNRANADDLAHYDQYSVAQLLEKLNDSEVEFLGYKKPVTEENPEGTIENIDYAPHYYINAFTYDEKGEHNVIKDGEVKYFIDCWVDPVEKNPDVFHLPTKSRGNVVYVNKAEVPNAIPGEVTKANWFQGTGYTPAPAEVPEP